MDFWSLHDCGYLIPAECPCDPSVADIFLRQSMSSLTAWACNVAGGYWKVQVHDLVLGDPREATGSGFESWHRDLFVASVCGKNDCSVTQFPQHV